MNKIKISLIRIVLLGTLSLFGCDNVRYESNCPKVKLNPFYNIESSPMKMDLPPIGKHRYNNSEKTEYCEVK